MGILSIILLVLFGGCFLVFVFVVLLQLLLEWLDKVLERKIEQSEHNNHKNNADRTYDSNNNFAENNTKKKGLLWKGLRFIVNMIDINLFE